MSVVGRVRLAPAGMVAGMVAAVLAGLIATVLAAPAAWAATSAAPAGAVGYDVSFPQCKDGGLPSGGAFGIVGVNGGRAFSSNPCFASQLTWATGRPHAAGVYINTGNPAPASQFYWPTSGSRDPALCRDNRLTTDPGCAYDYGWHAAADALAAARKVDRAVVTLTWWLDVEAANSWNGDTVSNAADLQGALDHLRSNGVASVGLYSGPNQWKTITGGYTASTADRYRAAWAPAFTPRFPLESAPLWIATGGDAKAAAAACGTSFTGAKARLAQYSGSFDTNVVCGTPAAATKPAAKPAAPTALSVRPDSTRGVRVGWSAPASDGGAAIRSYSVLRGSSATRTTAYATVTCTTPTCTFSDTGAVRGRSYFYTVAATNSAGTGPAPAAAAARSK